MKNITFEEAMKTIINEFSKDKSQGSCYFAWQSNIAMKIFDNSDLDIDKCNLIAKKFLDYLIEQVN